MTSADKESTVFHLLLIGESGVGKSCLLKRFEQGTYRESYSPTSAVNFRTCCIHLEGKTVKLEVNDVPGKEQYREEIANYYKKADGVIVVFDVTNEESFKRVDDWVLQLDRTTEKDVTMILVGNKLDMQAKRVIFVQEAEELANKWAIKYMETSAKDGSNVAQIFLGIAADIHHRRHPPVEEAQRRSDYREIRRRLESIDLSRPRIPGNGNQGRFSSKKSQCEPCDYNLNIILLGDVAVGKSCLMVRFTEDHFSGLYSATIGMDFKTKKMEIDGHSVKLQIVDTAGQEKFHCLTSSFYRGADGIIIVYDITNSESFFHLEMWMKEIDAYAREDVNKILVGTKCDLTEKKIVEKREAERLAKSLDIPFFETSAKDATNVEEVFKTLAESIIKRMGLPKRRNVTSSRENLKLSDAPRKRRWRC